LGGVDVGLGFISRWAFLLFGGGVGITPVRALMDEFKNGVQLDINCHRNSWWAWRYFGDWHLKPLVIGSHQRSNQRDCRRDRVGGRSVFSPESEAAVNSS
jgi:hypothetical protein